MKIEKILIPFDGSDYSLDAIKCALTLAKQFDAHVTIINCYELSGDMHSSELSEEMLKDVYSGIQQGADELLKKAETFFAKQGVEYKLKAISGAPGDVLTELAKSKQYDLIVMGSHGHSNVAGAFLGSVTHDVLNTIYCPVLIVP